MAAKVGSSRRRMLEQTRNALLTVCLLQMAGNAERRWEAVGGGGRRWEAVGDGGISVVCLQMYKTNAHGLLIKSD